MLVDGHLWPPALLAHGHLHTGGQFTNAGGFPSMLSNLLAEEKPTPCQFDVSRKTFRTDKFPSTAQREDAEEPADRCRCRQCC